MKENRTIISLLMAMMLLLSACGQTPGENDAPPVSDSDTGTQVDVNVNADNVSVVDSSEVFSDRDFEIGYDENTSALIQLNGDSAQCSSDAVRISGGIITILDEGTYILSGTLDDGMVIVDSEKTDKTQIVLNGVTIHSETSAPLYILQSDKVFVTTAENTVNTLSNGGSFTAIDENNIDAAVFSKEDITFNGAGTLVVTSPGGHGIVSKDSLAITGGAYDINCASHALSGKDDVSIADGSFTIVSGKDGVHAENSDDASLGQVYIQSGTFDISAEGDGVSAAAQLQIEDADLHIVSGGGSANAQQQTSSGWGGFMGGGRHGTGGKGGMGGMRSPTDTSTASASEDSTSIKGIKAGADLVINGGTYLIDTADDAVHSNASVTINGGSFEIASGDDAFHADDTLTVSAGTILVTASYEGLEGLHVIVSGGDVSLVADDDGLNAAGGTDSSGMGGHRGGDRFGSSSNGSILISGGSIYANASGDGIDSNGTLEITGGSVTICGPSNGDTATLDYDTSGVITGGTFIGTGGSMMAQTFSGSEQGVVSVSVGNQSAGTAVTLSDSSGELLLSCAPERDFAVVILSSPDLVKGETYIVTVGTKSGEFEAE